MVLGRGLQLTLAGVVIGVLAALAATRLISTMIYGVTASDPMTFVAVTIFLMLVTLLACYVPARRATRVDPLAALRYELLARRLHRGEQVSESEALLWKSRSGR